MRRAILPVALLLALLVAGVGSLHGAQAAAVQQGGGAVEAPESDYIISAQDVLNVTVWENPDLTGKFTVQGDGTITLPLVGHPKAAGLTVRGFEALLTRLLADGLIREPRVAVTLEQFRGRRIFVFGNVNSPGTYPLREGETLIEALARVGYASASEAVILRPAHPSGPTLPEQAGDAEVIRINLRELEKDVEHGSLARNVALRDGDTVFVPRLDLTRIFVSGQVRNPGAYPITEKTSVLQALTLAGGVNEAAAVNRIHIIRFENGKQRSINVRLSDMVQPGDTLVVPERYF
jgi:polysaccharide biosynthesis/export protein